MSTLGDALTRAHGFLEEARTHFEGDDVQEGVPRWTWVAAVLTKAAGEFDGAHLRLNPDEVPPTPSWEEADPAAFGERLDEADEAMAAARRAENEWSVFSSGMEKTEPDDTTHETGVRALQQLYRLSGIAQQHANAAG